MDFKELRQAIIETDIQMNGLQAKRRKYERKLLNAMLKDNATARDFFEYIKHVVEERGIERDICLPFGRHCIFDHYDGYLLSFYNKHAMRHYDIPVMDFFADKSMAIDNFIKQINAIQDCIEANLEYDELETLCEA